MILEFSFFIDILSSNYVYNDINFINKYKYQTVQYTPKPPAKKPVQAA